MLFCFAYSAVAERDTDYRNIKAVGMGDTRIAGGMEYNGFIDNPALLSRVKTFRLSIVNLPLTINKDLSDMAEFINDNREKFEKFDELTPIEKEQFIKDVEPYDGQWGRVNVSPMVDAAVSFMGQSFGLAVFSVDDVAFKIDRGIYEPRVWGEGVSDVGIVLGYARPLSILVPGLTVGANVKYIERRTANLFQIKASDLGEISDTMDPILDAAQDNESTHIAVDVGALYEVPIIGSEVGAVVKNFGYGPTFTLDLGITKKMLDERLILLADYRDFLDKNDENGFKKIHLGAEYDLGLINLRAGLNSGYPTAGLGLNLKLLQIDAAYFIDELGNAPGVKDDPRYAVQMRLGW